MTSSTRHVPPTNPQLEKDDAATDVAVTRTDQDRINAFSRLNSRADEIVELLDGLTKQKEDLEEVETEMELVDDEEQVMSVPAPSLPPSLANACSPRAEHPLSLSMFDHPPCHPASRYKIDTTFVHLPASEALEHLQAALEKIRTEVDSLETEKQECEDKMDELKKDLYAKFGSKWDHVSLRC